MCTKALVIFASSSGTPYRLLLSFTLCSSWMQAGSEVSARCSLCALGFTTSPAALSLALLDSHSSVATLDHGSHLRWKACLPFVHMFLRSINAALRWNLWTCSAHQQRSCWVIFFVANFIFLLENCVCLVRWRIPSSASRKSKTLGK